MPGRQSDGNKAKGCLPPRMFGHLDLGACMSLHMGWSISNHSKLQSAASPHSIAIRGDALRPFVKDDWVRYDWTDGLV